MSQVKSLQTGIKFKDTPIGKIPVDWEATKLQRIGVLKGGNGFPEKFQGHKNKDYFFLKVSDMNLPGNEIYINFSSNTIDKEIQAAIGCNLFPKDTIIYAKVGAALLLNRRRILTRDSCIDNNMMGLIVSKDENYKFYYYIMQTIDFAKFVSSGALPSINQTVLGGIDVIRPPLPEQKRIAEILTTVDNAIEETDRIIERTKGLKKGLMQKLLTRGIGHKKFKKTGIGRIPEEWEVVKLGNVCDVFGGSTPSTAIKEYWDGDILWATPTDITNLKGRTIEETKQRISEKGLKSCAANLLPEGSILMTSRATIGACAINTKPMSTNQGFASLVCKERAYNWFVYYLVLFFRKEIERLGSGSTFKEVSKKSIRSFYIPLPSFSEQKEIADILAVIDLEINNEEANKQNLESLKKSLMQVLLTGRVRVKLQ